MAAPRRDGSPTGLVSKTQRWSQSGDEEGTWIPTDLNVPAGEPPTEVVACASNPDGTNTLYAFSIGDIKIYYLDNNTEWQSFTPFIDPHTRQNVIGSLMDIKVGYDRTGTPFYVIMGRDTNTEANGVVWLKEDPSKGCCKVVGRAPWPVLDWAPACFDSSQFSNMSPRSEGALGVAYLTTDRDKSKPDQFVVTIDNQEVLRQSLPRSMHFGSMNTTRNCVDPKGAYDRFFAMEYSSYNAAARGIYEIVIQNGQMQNTLLSDSWQNTLSRGSRQISELFSATQTGEEVHLFCLNAAYLPEVLHKRSDGAGGWTDFQTLELGLGHVTSFVKGSQFATNPEVFIEGAADPATGSPTELFQVWQDTESRDWFAEVVEQAAQPIQPRADTAIPTTIPMCMVQIALYDQDIDVPVPSQTVWISASEQIHAEINGQWVSLTRKQPWKGTSNVAGEVNVALEIGQSLGMPQLEIVVGEDSSARSTIIDPAAPLRDYLGKITAKDLATAKTTDAEGKVIPLIPGSNPQATAATLATGLTQVLGLAAPPTAIPRHLAHPLNDVRLSQMAYADVPQAMAAMPDWHMVLDPDNAGITRLSGVDSQASARQKRIELPSLSSVLGQGIDWGDVMGAIVSNAAKLTEVIKSGARLVLTVTVGGVAYVFDAVLSAAGRILDLVQEFFASVGVPFLSLFNWLGHVFDWTDILLTKDAIKHTLLAGTDFAERAMGFVETTLTGGMNRFRADINKYLDSLSAVLVGNADPKSTIQTWNEAQLAKGVVGRRVVNDANAINFVHHAMINHTGRVVFHLPAAGTPTDAFAAMERTLSLIQRTFGRQPEYIAAMNLIDTIKDQPSHFLQLVGTGVISVIRGLVDMAIRLGGEVVHVICAAISAGFAGLKTLLTTPITIPVVSTVYQHYAKAPLTFADALALLVAIPSTIVSKALTSHAPFADETAVETFKARFTANALVAQLPKNSQPTPAPQDTPAQTLRQAETDDTVPTTQLVFEIFANVTRAIYIVPDVIMDVNSTQSQNPMVNGVALGLGWLSFIFGTPLVEEMALPDCTTFGGVERTAWILDIVPNALDTAVFVATQLQTARFAGPWGEAATFFAAALGLAMTGFWATKAESGGQTAEVMERAFDGVPGIFKWVGIIPKGAPVLGVIDFVFGIVTVSVMSARIISQMANNREIHRGISPVAYT